MTKLMPIVFRDERKVQPQRRSRARQVLGRAQSLPEEPPRLLYTDAFLPAR